mgnify:CR=1 FL=1
MNIKHLSKRVKILTRLSLTVGVSSLLLNLTACGGDTADTTATTDPFTEIEARLAERNVSTATIDGMWIFVIQVDETILIDEAAATEVTEKIDYVHYQSLQLKQSAGGGITYDGCAGNTLTFSHSFGFNLTATTLTFSQTNDYFTLDADLDLTVSNNTVIDFGEFRASGNNDIKYKAKAYKYRDDVTSAIGSLNTNIGIDNMHCLDYKVGTRTALFTDGAGIVPFHQFSINNNSVTSNSIWLRNIEEQSNPVKSDIIYTDSGNLYNQDALAIFNFNQSTFPNYSGSFSLVDDVHGNTSGTFTIDLSD